jgi:hypothetical protein
MPKQIDVQSDGTPVVTGLVNAALSLVSSDKPGEVKIDADTGVMSVNNSYGTNEQATGETWIDGKPIYRKALVGNIVESADATHYLTISTGVDVLVNYGGCWQPGSALIMSVNHTAATGSRLSGFIIENPGTTDDLQFFSVTEAARSGTSNNAYKIWAEYTKLQDPTP